jgi:hypothetical protein
MALQNACRSGYEAARNGQSPILTPDEHDDLVSRIAEGSASHYPMTMQDIIHRITERYGETMDANFIRHVLVRNPRIKRCSGLAMEEMRLQVTAEDIPAYFASLSQANDGVPVYFVSNMDETGHQKWADCQE